LLAILLASLVAAAQRPPVLLVRLDGDATLPCPAGATLTAALKTRLSSSTVVNEGTPQDDDLLIALTPDGIGWRLEVSRADGSVALQRHINSQRAGCEDVADIGALIVERHLIDIEWPGRPVSVDPLASAEVKTEAAPVERRPIVDGLDVEVGGAGRAGVPTELAPGLSVDIGTRAISILHVSLWGYFGTSRSVPFTVGGNSPVTGTLWMETFFASATASFCGEVKTLVGCAGPLFGTAIAIGWSQGFVYQTHRSTEVIPAAGVLGRLTYPIAWKLGVTLEVGAVVPLGRATFQIEDYPTAPEIRSAAFDVVGALRLGWVF
jgi:hypothetical protein